MASGKAILRVSKDLTISLYYLVKVGAIPLLITVYDTFGCLSSCLFGAMISAISSYCMRNSSHISVFCCKCLYVCILYKYNICICSTSDYEVNNITMGSIANRQI